MGRLENRPHLLRRTAMTPSQPSPVLVFQTINAYQQSAALRAAIAIDLFTVVGTGSDTVPVMATRCGSAERGVRILADTMAIIGFLVKEGDRYRLTPDAAAFLDRRSPAYFGSAVDFLFSPELESAFGDLTAAVRQGGTALPQEGTVSAENPVWVRFARAMAPLMALPAERLAELVGGEGRMRILDIAAGHGLFGIAIARRNHDAEVLAVDWPAVLAVAEENARAAGVDDRFESRPGSAFEVDLGSGYDLALLTNFLHHFDPDTCVQLLTRVHAALAEGGRVATLEFVPNDDRVSPPEAAAFALVMLATTPCGDAYTFAELSEMFRRAGFSRSEIHPLPPSMEQVVISYR
jgi:ubiquinone/menaquinone biosynthesis C-methylase UbiE